MPARRTVVVVAGLVLVLSIVFISCWPAAAQNESPGRKLAFLVGVKEYKHSGLKNLDYSENDVEELADVLKQQNFSVTLLTTRGGRTNQDRLPTAENIRRTLAAILKDVTKKDLIVVGLAGHGMQPLSSNDAYFCPYDANPSQHDGKLVRPETLISIGEVLGQFRDSCIGQRLLLVDACRDDPQIRSGRRSGGVTQVDFSALPPQTGVLLSCSPGEFAFEHKSLGTGHGVFFFHVIEGLKGAAHDTDTSEITWDGLRSYLKRRVPATVRSLYGKDGGEQRPNEVGNLSGEPPVLAIASIGIRPEPNKVMRKPEEPAAPPSGPFAGTRTGQTRDDNGLQTKFVWIPSGEFTMGSPKDEKNRHRSTEDQVQVTLTKGFWLGQHEVTQAEWHRVMQPTPWSGKQYVKEGDNYPATCVSWNDAMNFCRKLTEQERATGRLPSSWQYTLPTEAQWEYACRAGTTSRFSFGDDDSNLGDYAWSAKNAAAAGELYAHMVGQKKANPWGLFDMHGNVEEWCSDYFQVQRSGGADPQGRSQGSSRNIRGGSWYDDGWFGRSAQRDSGTPDAWRYSIGFRIAAVPSGK